MADKVFDFQVFLNESKETLLKPAEYFAKMPKEGGLVEPIIKGLIYAVVAALIGLIVTLITPAAPSFGTMGAGVSISGIMLNLVYSIIGLFIGGAILLVLSAICGGNTNYEANLRAVASLMVLSPVYALLGLFGCIGHAGVTGVMIAGILVAIAGLAVIIYACYMMYHALVKALGGKEGRAKVICIILAVIPTLVIISGLVCAGAVMQMAK